MRILTSTRILGLGLACSFAAAAAAPASEPAPEINAPEMNQAAAEAGATESQEHEKDVLHCPDSTATRIKRSRQRCASPGRVYTADDIRSTGATNVGEALELLDPAITVRRY